MPVSFSRGKKEKEHCDLILFEFGARVGIRKGVKDWGLEQLPFVNVPVSRGNERHIHIHIDSPLKSSL